MKANETELIKSSDKKQLTAKGYKLMYGFINKAADANNVHRMKPEFKEKKEKMINLFNHLVFVKRATFSELSDLLKKIEVSKSEPIEIVSATPFFV